MEIRLKACAKDDMKSKKRTRKEIAYSLEITVKCPIIRGSVEFCYTSSG
jgi:hypothetical protein